MERNASKAAGARRPKRRAAKGRRAIRAATASEALRGGRFGAPDPVASEKLRALRVDAGMSRSALVYLAWQRLGVRVASSALTKMERGEAPIAPVVAWAYERLLSPASEDRAP